MRVLVAIAVAVSISGTGLAKDAKAADPAKKICRSQEAVGTMFTKRVCHTAAEWAKIDESNRKDAQDFDDNRRNNPNLPR
jgi:hypothetical protein